MEVLQYVHDCKSNEWKLNPASCTVIKHAPRSTTLLHYYKPKCVGGYIVFWKANQACPASKISEKLQKNNDGSIIINLSYRMTTRKKANVLTKNDVTAHSNQNNTMSF